MDRRLRVLVTVSLLGAAMPTRSPAQPPLTQPPPILEIAKPEMQRPTALRPWLDPPAQLPGLSPAPAALTPPPPPLAGPQRFEPSSLRLKSEGGRWQLWAGNLMLKDFGPADREANEALQIFRDLRVNSHGSVGGVFEYWLTDGLAPSALTRHKLVIPFDPRTLRVEQVSDQWVLRDGRTILYSFGHSQSDALQALAICKQYQFDQLGYVGHPTPALKYLMKDPNDRKPLAGIPSLTPVSAAMMPAEIAHPRLVLPGVGDVGERVPFDGRRLDLRREGGEWVMYSSRTPVAHFGLSEREARTTLETLEQFRVTELCRIGENGFGFFLANGRAPSGTTIGTSARALRTEALTVRQVGGRWAVCEGTHVLFDFGERGE
ncbi:MAG TPA: hypothetical protein VH120_12010, partial [Gemmataceae bacterium]|nr:hypothetical protein [Gemmataceae bacterium]